MTVYNFFVHWFLLIAIMVLITMLVTFLSALLVKVIKEEYKK